MKFLINFSLLPLPINKSLKSILILIYSLLLIVLNDLFVLKSCYSNHIEGFLLKNFNLTFLDNLIISFLLIGLYIHVALTLNFVLNCFLKFILLTIIPSASLKPIHITLV